MESGSYSNHHTVCCCWNIAGEQLSCQLIPRSFPDYSTGVHPFCGTNYGTQTTRCHCKLSSVAFVMVKQSSLPNVPTCVDLAYSPSFDGYLELSINVHEVSMVGIAT